MRSWILIVATLVVLVPAETTSAGKYNPERNIGDAAPVWKDLPGTDGKTHSLADLKDKEAIVVVVTCNTCPYAVEYEDRIIEFTKKHAGEKSKIAVVALSVNTREEADLLPAMKERAQEKKFPFAYLFDASQKIGRDFGATRTPEFFVLDKQRKIIYMGAMDDSTDPKKVTKNYVELAVQASLAGKKPETEETVAIGCGVRYERKSRVRRRKKSK